MKVGSKVVCIDDSNWSSLVEMYFDKLPVKGRIYIVRRIINGFSNIDTPGIALHSFYGRWDNWLNNDGVTVYEEAHFRWNRFQEVDDEINEMLDKALGQFDEQVSVEITSK